MTDRLLILAKVLHVYDNVYYNSCRRCYSKLHVDRNFEEEVEFEICLKCGEQRKSTESVHRYRVSLQISDGNTNCDVTVFGTQLEQFIGSTARYLHMYTQWMAETGVDSSLLRIALEQVFCNNWFLFGFKLKDKFKVESPGLIDVINTCSVSQIQSGNSRGLIAWQMVRACGSHTEQVSVISLLKHFVHRIIGQRGRLNTLIQTETIQNRSCLLTTSDLTPNSSSNISFFLCDLDGSTSSSLTMNQSMSMYNVFADTNYTSLVSRNSPGSIADFQADTADIVKSQVQDSFASNKLQEQNLTHVKPPLVGNLSTCEISVEMERAGTQDAVNGVLLELDGIDFSDSFSEQLSTDTSRTFEQPPAINLSSARNPSNYSVDLEQSFDITRDVQNHSHEYYNLRTSCDDTMRNFQHFRKPCNVTQMPTNQSGSTSSEIYPVVNINWCNESGSTMNGLQEALSESKHYGVTSNCNDVSLWLCFDAHNMNCVPKENEDEITANESSLLLFQNDPISAPTIASPKPSHNIKGNNKLVSNYDSKSHKTVGNNKTETLILPQGNTSDITADCPYSEDLAAFLNSTEIPFSASANIVDGSGLHCTPKQLMAKERNDINSCPYSEDLVAFLNDTQSNAEDGFNMPSTVHNNSKTVSDSSEILIDLRASRDDKQLANVYFVPDSEESVFEPLATSTLSKYEQLNRNINLLNSPLISPLHSVSALRTNKHKNEPNTGEIKNKVANTNDLNCSNLSEDLFGNSIDDDSMLSCRVNKQIIGSNVLKENVAPEEIVSKAIGKNNHTRKSVCFAQKFVHQELIENIDYRMQTTPVAVSNNIGMQSCLRGQVKALQMPLQDKTNLKPLVNSPLPNSEDLFTPSPIVGQITRVTRTHVFHSTPLFGDLSSQSLFSSPEMSNSVVQNKINSTLPNTVNTVSVRNRQNSNTLISPGESSLFSNESLSQVGERFRGDVKLNSKSIVNVDSPKSARYLSDSLNDSDFVPSSCTRTLGRVRKIIL